MQYFYNFVTGVETIEVSESNYYILRELDRIEFNQNRKETRRHTSLEVLNPYATFRSVEVNYDLFFLIDDLYSAIDVLSDTHQRMIYLYFFEEYTMSEIAKFEAISTKAVSKRIHKAIDILRRLLCEVYGYDR